MVYVGVDVGGTGVQVGVVDGKGNILHKESIVTRVEDGWQIMIRDMAECVITCVRNSGIPMEEVASVGVGVPGISIQETGFIPFCTNLKWENVPFRQEFQKYLDKPVWIDNDATVAGLAESVAGVSAGTSSSVFLTLGTGVGGGIIINGKVWTGAHGVASEIGHMILKLDGEPCTCGNRGCLERYTSATAIIRMGREAMAEHPESAMHAMTGNDPAKLNAKIVFDAAKAGDPAAKDVFDRYVSYLGQAIGTIINFFDPEVIVLGGGVSRAGDFLLDAVREEAPKYRIFKALPCAHIELAKLGPDAGIIGAAMLGLDK